jgi:hypothetical protein
LPKKKQTVEETVKELEGLIGRRPTHGDKELRQDGWMTIDEFVQMIIPGLESYLKGNWGFRGSDDLHHPVDLFTTASIYMDVAYHVAEGLESCRHEQKY